MITSERMAAVDANAAALGVPRKQLMESSGNAIARAVRDAADPGSSVTLVCGQGNNGGDAFVAARFLSAYDVRVVLLGRPESIATRIARENWDALERAEIPRETATDSSVFDPGHSESTSRPIEDPDVADAIPGDPDVVVDAMLGTGVSGALREPERSAATWINGTRDAGATVIAVDVPSGIDADTGEPTGKPTDGNDSVVVEADHVVTFHDEKPGLAALDASVTVADIGIPPAAELFTGPGDLRAVARNPESHKGDNGTVLVVGGGPYTGAPALSARAALRAGADLARVACPRTVAREVQGYSPDLIVHSVPGDVLAHTHVDAVMQLAAEVDVVVLGPGLGDDAGTRAFTEHFLGEFTGRAVVDADALASVPEVETKAELICTPHQGELVEMGGETHADPRTRSDLVREFARDLGVTMLVKGAVDVVAAADGEHVRLNRTGNPGMTVGGTGDVLAGTVGALAATIDPFQAAAIGAYVTGDAGDRAAETHGYGLVATDLIDRLPQALYNDE